MEYCGGTQDRKSHQGSKLSFIRLDLDTGMLTNPSGPQIAHSH